MIGVYRAAFSALLAAGHVAALRSPKLRRGLEGRRGLGQRIGGWRFAEPPLWFHFASSGEFEQIVPVLDRLRERGGPSVVLTYFSPSGERAVRLETERRFAAGRVLSWDAADFAPWDRPRDVREFLDGVRPRALVCVHREIWPELLVQCGRSGIPRHLIAAHFPRPLSIWYRRWARELDGVLAVDAASAARFAMGASVAGDPRVDRVLARREAARSSWTEALAGRPNVVVASAWDRDLRALAPALEAVGERARWILVPHEPSRARVERCFDLIRSRGWQARAWSEWRREGMETPPPHLVVDGVGFLAELYDAATAVIVGGSFHARVHNVLEPAVYARPIFTGPRISNSREAVEMQEHGLLRACASGEELATGLSELLADPGMRARWAGGLESFVRERSGAADRCAEYLFPADAKKKAAP